MVLILLILLGLHRPAMPTLRQLRAFNANTEQLRKAYQRSPKAASDLLRLKQGMKRQLLWLSRYESKSKFDR